MPDDALRALADAGKLHDPAVLRAQVERMLQHPKAEAFIENFTGQWLNLTEIDATTPDSLLYPEFDEVLRAAMLDETHAFVRELVSKDLSVTNVVDSSFTIINSRLARHYGISWPGGEGVQRVTLRPEDRRGGLITQASVLKVTANGTTTSPVLRGVWMMERIIGQPVPPVPANVPAIEPDIRGAKTIREQLAKHRTHRDMCGLSRQDRSAWLRAGELRRDRRLAGQVPSGRGRRQAGQEREGRQRGRLATGPAVDPSYTTADGKAFEDVADFKRILLADPDQLARNLASKLLTYGTGAGITFADRAVLDDIVAKTREHDHGVRSLIHAVVTSDSFLNK